MGINNILLATIVFTQLFIIAACGICNASNHSTDTLEKVSMTQTQQQAGDELKSSDATTAYEVIIFEPMYITATPNVQNDYADTTNNNTVNNEIDDTLQKYMN